jgi:hypothetical protein
VFLHGKKIIGKNNKKGDIVTKKIYTLNDALPTFRGTQM